MRIPQSEVFDIGSLSDVGRERSENQDSVGYFQTSDGRWSLFLVCDGMGGHAGGQRASQLAVEVIGRAFGQLVETRGIGEALERAIVAANTAIFNEASENPTLKGMGTTCVAVVTGGGEALFAHVGDSRIYRIRPRSVEQLTKDHTAVQRMVDGGLLTEEEAREHTESNVLARCLGVRETVQPELRGPEPVLPGDRLLLCSDGLTGLVEDEIIAAIASMYPPQEAVSKLVELANDHGGHDNISVQLVYRKGRFKPTGKFRPDRFERLPKPSTPREPRRFPSPLQVGLLAVALFVAAVAWYHLKPSKPAEDPEPAARETIEPHGAPPTKPVPEEPRKESSEPLPDFAGAPPPEPEEPAELPGAEEPAKPTEVEQPAELEDPESDREPEAADESEEADIRAPGDLR